MVANKTRKKQTKVSQRLLAMYKDPESVWGKAKELEKFWNTLSSGKNVVLIYKDKSYKVMKVPARNNKLHKTFFSELETNNDIVAILSSAISQDSYELFLYPKAKDKSVDYVIKNYTKYFKPLSKSTKLNFPY